MRRALAALLILFFGLGPLTATLQADDESRLPACCRRHGAHHCSMADAMRAQLVALATSKTPALTAPSHCPLYPHSNSATTAPNCAMAAVLSSADLLAARRLKLDLPDAMASNIARLNRTGRSPPLSKIL